MSEAQPPVEELVVFNADNFRDAQPVSTSLSDTSKLDFPIAQGIETFPNGIIFGDGTTMNSAAWTNKTTPKYEYGGYPAQSLSIGSAIEMKHLIYACSREDDDLRPMVLKAPLVSASPNAHKLQIT